jgi:hypothetical protein
MIHRNGTVLRRAQKRLVRGNPLLKGQVMRVTTRLVLLAAGIATPIALALPAANAITTACVIGDGGHCGGAISHQSAPLEIAVAVPVSQVRAGTPLVGMTPAFSARADWDVRPPFAGSSDRVFRWAPRGVRSPLCITATRDVAGSRLRLQPCRIGSAGSSHQVWRPVNVIDSGYRVYKNVANGLVMTLVGDSNGAPLQIRSMGLGTGGNKNFKIIHTAP